MTDKNYTHVEVVLDRSGSMTKIKSDMEGGYDEFMTAQRKLPGRMTVTLNQFDTIGYDTVYEKKSIEFVPGLDLQPRGGTPLLDAIGRTINVLGAKLDNIRENERPGLVNVLVITDGLENASHEFDLATINEMIKHQTENYQWMFTFLGANQDALKEGVRMGFAAGQSITYNDTKAGVSNVYGAAGAQLAAVRASVSTGEAVLAAVANNAFTDEDREAAKEE